MGKVSRKGEKREENECKGGPAGDRLTRRR